MQSIGTPGGMATLVKDVERGLDHGEFFFVLQPRYRLLEKTLSGCEYLIRWRRADGSICEPAAFLSVVEDSSLARRFTDLLLERAVNTLAHWSAGDHGDLVLAINLAAGELGRGDLPAHVATMLAARGIDPSRLEIDLTGVVTPDRLDWLVDAIQAMQAVGVRVAMDDFGTGFNALTLLQQLPVDIVKFGRAWLRDVPADAALTSTLTMLVRLAQGLGKQIVLKGLETAAQLDWASSLDAVEGQGYFICAPEGEATIDAFAGRIVANRGRC